MATCMQAAKPVPLVQSPAVLCRLGRCAEVIFFAALSS